MSSNKNKIAIVLITLIITLVVLGGGQLLWQRYKIDIPLTKTLQGIDGVESVNWDKSPNADGSFKISISLTNVKNLQQTYQAINTGTTSILGSKKPLIIIHDSRTPELEQFYYTVHYYIQESIAIGNFTTMAERIEHKAAAQGVDTQLFVDSDNIYLGLTKNSANMYIVISRQAKQPEVR